MTIFKINSKVNKLFYIKKVDLKIYLNAELKLE